ncbi:MAG: hypothetical protein E7277_00060 [Lachnospiraceae bacterium]|nr:hypothetical protein [Lachnospiraceae bacterium]
MRRKLVLRNLFVAGVGQIVTSLLGLIVRAVFVRTLGIEYLGVSGIFYNIMAILSLSELGIGIAIVYKLYEPIALEDVEKVKSYMAFFRKAYLVIGGVVLVLGLLLTPVVPYLAKDKINIPHIYLIYILFVLESAVSYVFSYKKSLIIANQKKYIVDTYCNAGKVARAVLGILFLIKTRNYIGFLAIQIITGVLFDVLVNLRANKMFPYLRDRVHEPLSSEASRDIREGTSAMLVHKVSTIIVKGTDNLLLSKIVGMAVAGIYANYAMISNAINGVLTMIFASMTASIGNYTVVEEKENQRALLEQLSFFEYWIVSFCAISLAGLWNPFIRLWIGKKYVFAEPTVLMLALCFYVSGRRMVILMFRDAMGLFRYDYKKAIGEAIGNLLISIVLGHFFGTIGIFAGTVITMVVICLPIEPRVLYEKGFACSALPYYGMYVLELVVFLLLGGGTLEVVSLIQKTGIVGFIMKAGVCLVVPNIGMMLVWGKTKAFRSMLELGRRSKSDANVG